MLRETKIIANTTQEYEKMATNILEMVDESKKRNAGSAYTKKAIKARLLKQDPRLANFISQSRGSGSSRLPESTLQEINRQRATIDKRVRAIWWNFLSTKSYILYANEGDSGHSKKVIRGRIKTLVQ